MKTPDGIKLGLECCTADCDACGECPYPMEWGCRIKLMTDALTRIRLLETDNSCLNDTIRSLIELLNAAHEETAKVKRERDAAVSELPHNCWNCKYHLKNPIEETDDSGRTMHRYCDADCCYPDEENSSWEWRGICPENTEVSTDA